MSGQHHASIAALLEARRHAVARHGDLREEHERHSRRLERITADVDFVRTQIAEYEATLALLGHVEPPHPLNPES
ncbi:MAG: hypothetical protein MUC74_16585 [Ideonella sp.]|jgi:hypothetical protein|nr:hypothetical protein [Ideonella sp.]